MTYNLRSDHIRNWIISTSTEQRITEQKQSVANNILLLLSTKGKAQLAS